MPYLTPSSTPPDSNCRRLFIPNDQRMLAAFYGQLIELTEPHNWEQLAGDISVADTVDIWSEIHDKFSQGIFCMIGAIVPILNDSTPSNMILCDGSTFLKSDYPELYAVLPAALIIDPNTGQLPDLRDSFLIGASASILEHSIGGESEHTLTVSELASHNHLYDKPTFNIDVESIGIPDPLGVGNPPIPTLTSSTGSGDAHNNMPPYYALKYAVIAK